MKAKGRVLITGAARRIGRTVALALAQAGWDIAAHYNSSADEAETLAAEIHALGRNATLIQADLEKTKGIESLVAALTPETTALVHNASLFERDENDAAGTRHKRVNLEVPLLLTEKFFDLLPESQKGSVVFMLDNTRLPKVLGAYAQSRAALRDALPDLALLYAPRVRVNAVALGPTLRHARESEEHFESLAQATPLQHASAAEDVAEAVRFLLENDSMTGQLLNVDSGAHLMRF